MATFGTLLLCTPKVRLHLVAVHYGSYPRVDSYQYKVVNWPSNLCTFFHFVLIFYLFYIPRFLEYSVLQSIHTSKINVLYELLEIITDVSWSKVMHITVLTGRCKGRLSLALRKPGFARLTVDYTLRIKEVRQ